MHCTQPLLNAMGLQATARVSFSIYNNEEEIENYLEVDALLYQKIDDLVEAVTRKGDHHIDTPCMACLDGNYIANDINDAKIAQMEAMRVNDRNGK